jgi:RNA 3'-terminal phosphate cyclase-like protein
MSSTSVVKCKGCASFRQRVVFSILSGRRLRIDNIRDKDEVPGLRDFEVNFLRLIDALTNGTRVEINETGTSLRFQPGLPAGGTLDHDCGNGRSIGWFVEGILPMLPFSKKPTVLALSGITNDDVDFSVDSLRTVVLPTVAHFGIGDGLSLTLKRRGAPPVGGGLAVLTCPVVRELMPLNLVEEGYIRKVRGVAYSAKVSPQMANRVLSSSR